MPMLSAAPIPEATHIASTHCITARSNVSSMKDTMGRPSLRIVIEVGATATTPFNVLIVPVAVHTELVQGIMERAPAFKNAMTGLPFKPMAIEGKRPRSPGLVRMRGEDIELQERVVQLTTDKSNPES